MKKNNNYGQTIIEYTLMLGIVGSVLFAMSPMIQRGAQGLIKVVADQIGNQADSDQEFGDTGYLENSYVNTRSRPDKTTLDVVGIQRYIFNDAITITSQATMNLGYQESL